MSGYAKLYCAAVVTALPEPVDFCLGSASPRRSELMATQGYRFCVQPSAIDENIAPCAPAEFVVELARQKAQAVFAARGDSLPVLGADTIVACKDALLGKPETFDETRRMLRLLSGGSHLVLSGVALVTDAGTRTTVTRTVVHMADWSDADIARYWASGEPADKAGAYAIQGMGGAWVERIDGSYSGVVGLPLVETRALLSAAGIHPGPQALAA